jgi:hypothetical protein
MFIEAPYEFDARERASVSALGNRKLHAKPPPYLRRWYNEEIVRPPD